MLGLSVIFVNKNLKPLLNLYLQKDIKHSKNNLKYDCLCTIRKHSHYHC